MNFAPVLAGLLAEPAILAIIGAATIQAAVGFARWAAKKVGRFFG